MFKNAILYNLEELDKQSKVKWILKKLVLIGPYKDYTLDDPKV